MKLFGEKIEIDYIVGDYFKSFSEIKKKVCNIFIFEIKQQSHVYIISQNINSNIQTYRLIKTLIPIIKTLNVNLLLNFFDYISSLSTA